MVSLRDVGPIKRTISLRDGEISLSVQGLSARGIVILIDRFPAIRKMLSGRGGKQLEDMSVSDLIDLAPNAIAAIVAVGLGKAGDTAYEQEIEEVLTAGEQLDIIHSMLDLTFPKGLGHFHAILDKLGVAVESVDTGKVQGMKLPSQFNSVLSTATPQKPPGTTPPANSPDGEKSSLAVDSPPAQSA